MNQKSFGFINSFTLKMLAILSMVVDHIGYVLYPEQRLFRVFGRIAFPIFCFLIVEGFHHTRNHVNYFIRLCVFAFLSEIPFDLAFHGSIFYLPYQNVFFTLALGLASIFCLEEMNTNKNYVFLVPIICIAAELLHSDYGAGGVILISVFYLTKQMPWIRLILCALILRVFYSPLEIYGIFALIPITFYNGKRGPSAQMVFYWFYPVHLLVLYAIATYL